MKGPTGNSSERSTPSSAGGSAQSPATLRTAASWRRILAFTMERYPLAFPPVREELLQLQAEGNDDFTSPAMRARLTERLLPALSAPDALEPDLAPLEVTPRVSFADRARGAAREVVENILGALDREAIRSSLTGDERREILRGMILTRATDNELKRLFTSGEVRVGSRSFQGKGFRSLGQEAIFASTIRLRRGDSYRGSEDDSSNGAPGAEALRGWRGDIVAPMIRDLGAVLGMCPKAEMVREVINAQMGKAGPPMNGRDLHVGSPSAGILPAAAPLGISALTLAGIALALDEEAKPGAKERRVAISFIGDGGCSLGEWHEAINTCSVRRWPVVFCVQNNQTALSTPLADQTAVRAFADKAAGYGIPGVTVDGTDPDEIAAAFAWAVARARRGEGPTLLELVALRMCGHAHHDDMLYLGKEPPVSFDYPAPSAGGYADTEAYAYWSERDPIKRYASRLLEEGLIAAGDVVRWQEEATALTRRESQTVIEAPWPDPSTVGLGVVANGPPQQHRDPWAEALPERGVRSDPEAWLEESPPFDAKGRTYLEAIMLGIGDALRADPRVFVYGQDVGGKYGNAFLLLKPLLQEFGDRILNSTLAEGAVLGVAIGAALAGRRPIAEIQFNDFVATGFNQLVNNAAKIRYRWGASVPMVVRMPCGGLRSAGPYHSQDTAPWFYRTPGLKIVAPSTPHDARALLAAAVADPDPVLYYEHIALYRDPRIRQLLAEGPPEPLPIGRAVLRREGRDLAIVSYGAYVHVALRVAEKLAGDGIEAAVLDLRSLLPLDRNAVLALARATHRVLIVHEDTRTGSIGESVAAMVQEEAFAFLDAPIRIVGALDTPVPYSPTLEQAFLPSAEQVERAARQLLSW